MVLGNNIEKDNEIKNLDKKPRRIFVLAKWSNGNGAVLDFGSSKSEGEARRMDGMCVYKHRCKRINQSGKEERTGKGKENGRDESREKTEYRLMEDRTRRSSCGFCIEKCTVIVQKTAGLSRVLKGGGKYGGGKTGG